MNEQHIDVFSIITRRSIALTSASIEETGKVLTNTYVGNSHFGEKKTKRLGKK